MEKPAIGTARKRISIPLAGAVSSKYTIALPLLTLTCFVWHASTTHVPVAPPGLRMHTQGYQSQVASR